MCAVQNNCSSSEAFNSEIALKTSKELQLFWTAHINFVQDNANTIDRHKNWNILLFEEGLKIYGHVKSHFTKHWHGGASFAQKSDTPYDAISVSVIGTQMLFSLPQLSPQHVFAQHNLSSTASRVFLGIPVHICTVYLNWPCQENF